MKAIAPHRTVRLTGMVGESPSCTGEVGESPSLTGVVGESPSLTGAVGESPSLTGEIGESPSLTSEIGESPSLTGEIGETGPERQVAGEAQQDTISCRVVDRWQHRSVVLRLADGLGGRLIRLAGDAAVTG